VGRREEENGEMDGRKAGNSLINARRMGFWMERGGEAEGTRYGI
jgi:hypothetical protein